MAVKPRYDFEDAAVTAANGVYHRLGGAYNPDVVLWEVLEINKMRNVGGYLAALVNEVGVNGYLAMRERIIASVDPQE